jgi:hypothetical protein
MIGRLARRGLNLLIILGVSSYGSIGIGVFDGISPSLAAALTQLVKRGSCGSWPEQGLFPPCRQLY